MIKTFSKQELENLGANLPLLEQQKKLIEFFSFSMGEQRCLEEITNHKVTYTQRINIATQGKKQYIAKHLDR